MKIPLGTQAVEKHWKRTERRPAGSPSMGTVPTPHRGDHTERCRSILRDSGYEVNPRATKTFQLASETAS